MFVIESYTLAIIFCVITMLCWGSWPNTQKLAAKTWRFELYYWDFVTGILIFSILVTLTLGSFGHAGRPFLADLQQASRQSISYAVLGGVVWNLGNLLLTAAIAVVGMSVAFPIGIGIAWILGIVINFILIILDQGKPEGNPFILFTGVAVIIVAIILSIRAYRLRAAEQKKPTKKGILLSLSAGLLIAFVYGLVVYSVDNAFVLGGNGNLTPFTAVFFFGAGVFVSNLLFNTIIMRKPIEGAPVTFKQYWKGSFSTHLTGVLGGMIWMLGLEASFMAVGVANPAVSYALGNAAPVVAMLWGIFIWKEFKDAPKRTNILLAFMFICFLLGLTLITYSNIIE